MIAFDFEYYKPTSLKEALQYYNELQSMNKKVMYYNGGTEFISRARRNEINVDAIIDIKGIPECTVFESSGDNLLIGSSVTLTDVADSTSFPLLSKIAKTIATHTERNKITIGGNLMSHLPYRELIMPFLISNSSVHCFGNEGMREISIKEITSGRTALAHNEFITHIQTPIGMTNKPFFNGRKTKQSAINYPIVSLAAIVIDGNIQVACSGLCDVPFRNNSFESIINDESHSVGERLSMCIDAIPEPIIDDMQASKEYRIFIFKQTLLEMFHTVEGVDHSYERPTKTSD